MIEAERKGLIIALCCLLIIFGIMWIGQTNNLLSSKSENTNETIEGIFIISSSSWTACIRLRLRNWDEVGYDVSGFGSKDFAYSLSKYNSIRVSIKLEGHGSLTIQIKNDGKILREASTSVGGGWCIIEWSRNS